jgi:hypothetical protein
MAITFTQLEKTKGPEVIHVDEDLLENLSMGFDCLRQKYGLNVDFYGDTILYCNHQEVLIKFIDKLDKDLQSSFKELRDFLCRMVHSDAVVKVEGE